MSEKLTYGLSVKEQAIFLCALCRYSANPETCPMNLLRDIETCPFGSDCEQVPQWGWLDVLKCRKINFPNKEK